MELLKGITIKLYERTPVDIDDFNRPIYAETATDIPNVLIGEPTSEDIISELNLSGKRIAYTLAIPKGDNHEWKNATVEFYGKKWKTIGLPTEGIETMIPLSWNKKIKVEAYE